MKYLITTILAALSLQLATAQSFSAGLRTGLGYNVDLSTVGAKDIGRNSNQFTWDQEVYIRMQTNKKLAIEARFMHYALKDHYSRTVNTGVLMFPAETQFTYYDVKTSANRYVASISIQYDITCPFKKEHCPVFKNIRNYIGIDIAGAYSRETTTLKNTDLTSQFYIPTGKDNYFNMQYGLSHTIIYQVSKTFNINMSIRGMLQPGEFDSYNTSTGIGNSHITAIWGAGYTF